MPHIDVRCRCGTVYHADPAHAGRSLRCRCGRTVAIPATGAATPPPRVRRLPAIPFRLPRLQVAPRVRRLAAVLVWGYLALVVGSAMLLWTLGDRWWPATLLLFGPRWLLLVPLAGLVPLAALLHPRWLLVVGAAGLTALGPVMGYRLGWRRLLGGQDGSLRVVTFNIEGGANSRVAEVPASLADLGADVVVVQECPEALPEAARGLDGWTARRDDSLCLLSRYPVDSVAFLEELRTRSAGGTGQGVLYHLRTPDGPLRLGNLHLETPRSGIEDWRGQGETRRLIRNTLLRDAGSARISGWLRAAGAEIVGGDFNLPVESRIFRAHWSRCTDGFSHAGRGFGYTRILARFSVRIDHVLACRHWTPVRAFVGPDLGSDHRPMVADFRRR